MINGTERLKKFLEGIEFDPLAQEFVAAYQELPQLREQLPQKEWQEIEKKLHSTLAECVRSLRINSQGAARNERKIRLALEGARKFATIYKGTDPGRQAQELVSKCERMLSGMPTQKPTWLQGYQQRVKFQSIFDPAISEFIKELDSRAPEIQSHSQDLFREIVQRLHGLLQNARIDDEKNHRRLQNLLALKEILRESPLFGAYFDDYFSGFFDRVVRRRQYLIDRQTFQSLFPRLRQALKERDSRRAEQLLTEFSALSLIPREAAEIHDASKEIAQLRRINQLVEAALSQLEEQLGDIERGELEYRTERILESIQTIDPLLDDLPEDTKKEYESSIEHFVRSLRHISSPSDEWTHDIDISGLEPPLSVEQIPSPVARLFTQMQERRSLQRLLNRIDNRLAATHPTLSSSLQEQKGLVEEQLHLLSEVCRNWFESRLKQFFAQGQRTDVAAFLVEIEDSYQKAEPILEEDDLVNLLTAMRGLRQVHDLVNQLSSCDRWMHHQDLAEVNENLRIQYADAPLLIELEAERAMVMDLSLTIRRAEEALLANNISECETIVNAINGYNKNQRLYDLRQRLQTEKEIVELQEAIERKQFDQADTLLTSLSRKLPQERFDRLRQDLQHGRQAVEKAEEFRRRVERALDIESLIGLVQDIQGLLDSPLGRHARLEVSTLLKTVEVRLFNVFQSRIDQVDAIVDVILEEVPSIHPIQVRMHQLEDIRAELDKVTSVMATDSLTEGIDDKTMILSVQEAVVTKEYAQACALWQNVSKDRCPRERQYLERLVAFREAVNTFCKEGNDKKLIEVLHQPWYGQASFTLAGNEMWSLLKQLLALGRLDEIPVRLIEQQDFRLIKLVDDCLRRQNPAAYQALVAELQQSFVVNQGQVADILAFLLHDQRKADNEAGLLFLWRTMPEDLRKLVDDGHARVIRLEQALSSRITEEFQAVERIQREVEQEATPRLIDCKKTTMRVIQFLDECLKFQPQIGEDAGFSTKRERVFSLYSQVARLESAIDQADRLYDAGEWVRERGELEKLKRELRSLQPVPPIASRAIRKIETWVEEAYKIHQTVQDLKARLIEGSYVQALSLCRQLRVNDPTEGIVRFVNEWTKSLAQSGFFAGIIHPGTGLRAPETLDQLEQIIQKFQENAELTDEFIQLFGQVTKSFNESALDRLVQDWERANATRDSEACRRYQEQIQEQFYPPEVRDLLENKWPLVQHSLTILTEQNLAGFIRTVQFRTFWQGYSIITGNV